MFCSIPSSDLSGVGDTAWVCHSKVKWLCLKKASVGMGFQPWDWNRFEQLAHFETSYTTDALISSLSVCPNLVSLVLSHGDLRTHSRNLETFQRLKSLQLSHIAVYSDYPVRPKWSAFEDGEHVLSLLFSLLFNDNGALFSSSVFVFSFCVSLFFVMLFCVNQL